MSKTAALILAAGNSTRMGFAKQTAAIGSQTVITRTLTAFQNAPSVHSIVIVGRACDIAMLTALCEELHITKLHAICVGGNTRQQSAKNGMTVLPDDADFVAIHDGARPLVTPDLIDKVIAQAKLHGAALLAMPVKDTIKVASADGFIQGTPERAVLWQAQTPQVFRVDVYRRAMDYAIAHGLDFTDDCQLMERLSIPVKLVESTYQNIKITTPDDLTLAAAMLENKE